MRATTITLSIVAHVVGVCVLIIAPLFATDTLPEPRTTTEFVLVTPAPPSVPPPARPAQPATVAARPDSAPLVAPNGIQPEIPRDPVDNLPTLDTAVVSGIGDGLPVSEAPPPATPAPPGPVRVGGDIRPPMKTTDVAPAYPSIARAAHVEGVVILEATIGEDGAVRDVRILRSIPLLDAAASEAVRQWRFTPTLLNGQPVPVVMTVTVAFTLR